VQFWVTGQKRLGNTVLRKQGLALSLLHITFVNMLR